MTAGYDGKLVLAMLFLSLAPCLPVVLLVLLGAPPAAYYMWYLTLVTICAAGVWFIRHRERTKEKTGA